MKERKIKLLYFLILLLSLQTCKLEDESQPRYNELAAEPSSLLSTAIQQINYNHSAVGGRAASTIMQYLQDYGDSKVLSYNTYSAIGPSAFEKMWTDGFYAGSMIALQELKSLAEAEGNEVLQALALILLAHEFGTLTQYFGDIPFSEAVRGEAYLAPVFDTQETVLEGVDAMLDEAILRLGSETEVSELSNADLLYNGDLTLWRKLAYGLKARYLFNSRNQDQTRDDEILALIEKSFRNDSEEASFGFDYGIDNPQYTFPSLRAKTLKTGNYFVELLDLMQDPRKSRFTTLDDDDWIHFSGNDFVPSWFRKNAAIPLLSYTELLFARAELLYHKTEDPSAISIVLGEAIESSFVANEMNLSATENIVYIATVIDFSGLTGDEIHQRVMEQAYIAYYGNNHQQSWNNYRRTGYPAISSTASSIVDINPSNIVPRRFLYPEAEFLYNTANAEAAATRQDGALLDSEMWMFKK